MYYPSEAGIAVGAALNIADDFIEKIDKEFQDSIKGINTWGARNNGQSLHYIRNL